MTYKLYYKDEPSPYYGDFTSRDMAALRLLRDKDLWGKEETVGLVSPDEFLDFLQQRGRLTNWEIKEA